MNSKRIVSIKGTGRETNFEFHSNIFESIVNTVSENKLVVISTFGDKRVGKSFLLNYIIRFLTSTREDAWLDDHNPETGLSGFAWSENDPETNRGIWLSSYPITVICSDGETVDILLIDTKGTFNADEETSKKELEIFTAICVQLSSFVIFNVAEKISSGVLKKLSENVVATQSKIKRSNTNIPYFIFCVRDVRTTPPSQSGYEYLKKALNSSGEFGRLLTATLSNNDCVLMPFPGEMTQRRIYNGNAACLEQSFKKVMQEFISTTFNSDCLATLAVSPQNYIAKFKLLSKAYGVYVPPYRGNSRSRPNPNPAGKPPIRDKPLIFSRQTIQTALTAPPLASISENSPNYKFYMDSFTKFTLKLTKAFEDPFATEVVLQDSFKRFQNEALEYFADQDVQGDFRSIRTQEDQLANDMTAYFKAGIFNWKCKQEQIQNDIEAVLQQAIANCTEELKNSCKGPNLSRLDFKRYCETFRQQAEEYFETETSKYPPHLVQPHFQKLTEDIQNKFDSFQQQLDEKHQLGEAAAIEFAEAVAFQIYKSDMQNELKNVSFLKSDKFKRLHERMLRVAIGEFRKHVSFESFDKIESLSAQIGIQFKIYKEKNDSVEARVRQEISDIIYDLMREYNQDVRSLMLNPRISLLGFQNDHETLISITRAKFLSHKNDENACILGENWEKVSDSINENFQASVEEVAEIVSARRAKHEEESKQLAELMFNSFKIMTSDEALRRLDRTQVEKLCTDGKNEQLEKFRVGTADYDEDIRAKYLGKLEAQFDSECADVLDRFRLLTLESQLHLKEAILNAKEYYDSEMAKKFVPSTKFYKPADLLGIDLKILAEIRTRFCTKLFPPQISKVKDSLDPIFQVYERKNNMNTPNTSIAIGIDLGTTNSCVAVYHGGEVKVLEDENGKRTMPSYVAFINAPIRYAAINCQEVVGHAAKSMAYQHPKNTVYDIKRIIAKDFNDPILQEDMRNWAFQVIDEDGSPRIQIPNVPQLQTPEGISAKILRTLKNMAGKYLKTEIRDVVITVPAYFNDGQRNATRDAGELAGLNVLSIINEPTTAALAYFWENKQAGPINVLVYDLGGGTFDVSVLTMQNDNVEVLATGGSGHLGGQDFDNAIIDYCFEEFQKTTGVNLSAYKTSQNAIERERYATNRSLLKNIVEDVKISLSSTDSRPAIREALHKNLDLNVPITRENFNKINQARFDETLRIVEETLNQSGLSKKDINEVILVGGSSKILKVKEMLSEFFNKDIINHNVNPDEAVAKGAAIQAAILSGNQEQRLKNISLQDVTPLTLGLGIQNDVFSKIIPRNTRVPVSKTEKFYKKPNQKNITLKIYEGEEALASHNHFLGTYNINGLQETAEDEEIMVTMSINSENILRVSAEGAGISRKFVVQKKGRLTEEEKRRYLDGEEL